MPTWIEYSSWWAFGPDMRIMRSGERKGLYYATNNNGQWMYHATLEEAKAWVEAMYSLTN